MLAAAMIEFAKRGADGTSTEAIARRAGISQPYLFRLYPTKRALFMAAVERTFAEVSTVFRTAADGLIGLEAKHAMAEAYNTLLQRDRTFLGMQLQAYAACFGDAEIRALTRREFARLWETIVTISGMSEELAQAFFAHGMLCNLTAAFDIEDGDTDSLARRMTAAPALMTALIDEPVAAH